MLSRNIKQHLTVSSRLVTIMLFFLISLPRLCYATNYSHTYELLNKLNGSTYQLTISTNHSLYDYYQSKSHVTFSIDNLAKFVTPDCLSPIASSLRSIYIDDEDFANGVLTVIHQIPYEASTLQQYPVETLVQNKGDCDLFSFVAASIMKAGGLDVALLYYESVSHMNVGVNLKYEPSDARSTISYFIHDGKRYYLAECTGGNWESGWRVGECPNNVKDSSAQIITLERCEESSPDLVTSSLNDLTLNSSIFLAVSPSTIIPGKSISVEGAIMPAHSNVYVTIYILSNSGSWSELSIVRTNSNGQYTFSWTPLSTGIFSFKSVWSGDADHAEAESLIQKVFVVAAADTIILEVIDDSGKALIDAQVVIDFRNETFHTDEGGRVYLPKPKYENCSTKVYWKGVNVGTAILNVASGETQRISCSVYDLTIKVKNVLGIAALGGQIRVYGEETKEVILNRMMGIDGTLKLTQLPKGKYQIDILCAGSANSKEIVLNNSVSEVFLGIWDYTWYMVIAATGTIMVAMALLLLNRKN